MVERKKFFGENSLKNRKKPESVFAGLKATILLYNESLVTE